MSTKKTFKENINSLIEEKNVPNDDKLSITAEYKTGSQPQAENAISLDSKALSSFVSKSDHKTSGKCPKNELNQDGLSTSRVTYGSVLNSLEQKNAAQGEHAVDSETKPSDDRLSITFDDCSDIRVKLSDPTGVEASLSSVSDIKSTLNQLEAGTSKESKTKDDTESSKRHKHHKKHSKKKKKKHKKEEKKKKKSKEKNRKEGREKSFGSSKTSSSSPHRDRKAHQATAVLSSVVVQPDKPKDTSKRGVISKTNPETHDEFDDDWLSYKSEIAVANSKLSRKRSHSEREKRKSSDEVKPSKERKVSGSSFEEHTRTARKRNDDDRERFSHSHDHKEDAKKSHRRRPSWEHKKRDDNRTEHRKEKSISDRSTKSEREKSQYSTGKHDLLERDNRENLSKQHPKASKENTETHEARHASTEERQYEMTSKKDDLRFSDKHNELEDLSKKNDSLSDSTAKDPSSVAEHLDTNIESNKDKIQFKPKWRRKVSVVSKTFVSNTSNKTSDQNEPEIKDSLTLDSNIKNSTNIHGFKLQTSQTKSVQNYDDTTVSLNLLEDGEISPDSPEDKPGLNKDHANRQKDSPEDKPGLNKDHVNRQKDSPEDKLSLNKDHANRQKENEESINDGGVKLTFRLGQKVKAKKPSKAVLDMFADEPNDLERREQQESKERLLSEGASMKSERQNHSKENVQNDLSLPSETALAAYYSHEKSNETLQHSKDKSQVCSVDEEPKLILSKAEKMPKEKLPVEQQQPTKIGFEETKTRDLQSVAERLDEKKREKNDTEVDSLFPTKGKDISPVTKGEEKSRSQSISSSKSKSPSNSKQNLKKPTDTKSKTSSIIESSDDDRHSRSQSRKKRGRSSSRSESPSKTRKRKRSPKKKSKVTPQRYRSISKSPVRRSKKKSRSKTPRKKNKKHIPRSFRLTDYSSSSTDSSRSPSPRHSRNKRNKRSRSRKSKESSSRRSRLKEKTSKSPSRKSRNKSRSRSPYKGKEKQRKSSESPYKGKEKHRKSSESPYKGKEKHRKSSESPYKGKEKHRKSSESPYKGKEKHRKSSESPYKGKEKRRKSSESPYMGKEKHRKSSESPYKGKEKRRKSSESPFRGKEKRRKSSESPYKGKEKRRKSSESPYKGKEKRRKSSESPYKSKEKHRKSSESPYKGKEKRRKSSESPYKGKEKHRKSSESPYKGKEKRKSSDNRVSRSRSKSASRDIHQETSKRKKSIGIDHKSTVISSLSRQKDENITLPIPSSIPQVKNTTDQVSSKTVLLETTTLEPLSDEDKLLPSNAHRLTEDFVKTHSLSPDIISPSQHIKDNSQVVAGTSTNLDEELSVESSPGSLAMKAKVCGQAVELSKVITGNESEELAGITLKQAIGKVNAMVYLPEEQKEPVSQVPSNNILPIADKPVDLPNIAMEGNMEAATLPITTQSGMMVVNDNKQGVAKENVTVLKKIASIMNESNMKSGTMTDSCQNQAQLQPQLATVTMETTNPVSMTTIQNAEETTVQSTNTNIGLLPPPPAIPLGQFNIQGVLPGLSFAPPQGNILPYLTSMNKQPQHHAEATMVNQSVGQQGLETNNGSTNVNYQQRHQTLLGLSTSSSVIPFLDDSETKTINGDEPALSDVIKSADVDSPVDMEMSGSSPEQEVDIIEKMNEEFWNEQNTLDEAYEPEMLPILPFEPMEKKDTSPKKRKKRFTKKAKKKKPVKPVEENKTKVQVLLDKLHRQARVEEEVKIVLKEYYKHKEITKNEYKDILRRSVPQVANSNHSIDPERIRSLVKKYVAKSKGARLSQQT